MTTLSHLTFQDVETHVIITSFCDINNVSSNRCEIVTTLSHVTYKNVATDVTITSFGDVISFTQIRRNFVMTIRLKIVYVTNRRNYHVDYWLITSWQDFNLHVTWFSRHVPAGYRPKVPSYSHVSCCHCHSLLTISWNRKIQLLELASNLVAIFFYYKVVD